MNAPERFELFTLAKEQKKVTCEKDTKIPNAAMFSIQKEDHTLGNALRMQLLRDPNVMFAGYRMPHPLEHMFTLKIQTTPQSTPTKVLESALVDLINECSLLEERFKLQLQEKMRASGDTYL